MTTSTSSVTNISILPGPEGAALRTNTDAVPADGELSREDARKRIEQEDNLINQRLSWLIGSQSFLMGGFVMLRNNPQTYPREGGTLALTSAYLQQNALLVYVILVAGFLIALCSAIGVFAALMAVRRWRKTVRSAQRALLMSGARLAHLGGLAAVLPGPVFASIWVMLFISECPFMLTHLTRSQLITPLAVTGATVFWWLLYTLATHRVQLSKGCG